MTGTAHPPRVRRYGAFGWRPEPHGRAERRLTAAAARKPVRLDAWRGVLLVPEVHARSNARHGQGARHHAHDVQGRPPAAHRSAGDDARAAREDRSRGHHDHGRRHHHAAERSGPDPQGLRVCEERRLSADLHLARTCRARHHRADGEGVRHQGGDPQPRSRRQALAAAAGCLRRRSNRATSTWASASTSGTRRAPAPTRSRRAASSAIASTTCT